MYSRYAKGGEKRDPNRNHWLAKMLISGQPTQIVVIWEHSGAIFVFISSITCAPCKTSSDWIRVLVAVTNEIIKRESSKCILDLPRVTWPQSCSLERVCVSTESCAISTLVGPFHRKWRHQMLPRRDSLGRVRACANQWNNKAWILKMYSRSAKGGEKGDPNRNPWLAKMGEAIRVTFDRILRNFRLRMRALFQGNLFGATFDDVSSTSTMATGRDRRSRDPKAVPLKECAYQPKVAQYPP
jgi:hypothetical protein